jgi:hypothetical protein
MSCKPDTQSEGLEALMTEVSHDPSPAGSDCVVAPLPVVVQRWTRYGHDRAYVQVQGTPVGYRDLKTARVHCDQAEHASTIERATAQLLKPAPPVTESGYLPRHAQSAPADPVPSSSIPARPRTDQAAAGMQLLPDRDLALNRPGAEARGQATALRDAAPVRTLLARVLGVKTDERSWRIGADAEDEVGRRISGLGPEWRVLHAVPVGHRGSDIDHVVIGPAGVFTLNTKHHPDASIWIRGDNFKVNGQNQRYVRNSRHEAQRAAKLLSAKALFDVDVTALIVVMGARGGFTVKEQPRDGRVVVVTRKAVAAHLQALPPQLGIPLIERIFEVARHLATWQPTTVAWQDF